MHAVQDAFLFSAPGPTLDIPSTARKVHLRRLYDVLQLSIHRNDIIRARRAWSILVRCKEFHWIDMWGMAIHLVEENSYQNGETDSAKKIELLRDMMLHYPDQRVLLIKELVFRLIFAGRHREALDELELYLPSFPYADNAVLHIYAGLLCFYLSQGNSDTEEAKSSQPTLLRESTAYFERAQTLDPGNIVAASFLHKIANQNNTQAIEIQESDDDEQTVQDEGPPRAKRTRQMMSPL
ncbi:hypothetical protein GYMLUDRAFT_36605 [Collybiopsis luxurians FD-317 M1]|nr:hypothetical protein GYMLUDRAFT_36605 [Collybiopsis luxurians FD-317 M1]